MQNVSTYLAPFVPGDMRDPACGLWRVSALLHTGMDLVRHINSRPRKERIQQAARRQGMGCMPDTLVTFSVTMVLSAWPTQASVPTPMASVMPLRKGKTYANTKRLLYRLVRQEVRETTQVRMPLPPLRRKETGSTRGSDGGPGLPRLGRGCDTSCRCAM